MVWVVWSSEPPQGSSHCHLSPRHFILPSSPHKHQPLLPVGSALLSVFKLDSLRSPVWMDPSTFDLYGLPVSHLAECPQGPSVLEHMSPGLSFSRVSGILPCRYPLSPCHRSEVCGDRCLQGCIDAAVVVSAQVLHPSSSPASYSS